MTPGPPPLLLSYPVSAHAPRSRHRPVAVTDGSPTEKVNKTGVRLWTESSDLLTIVWIVLLIVLGGVRLAIWYYEGK